MFHRVVLFLALALAFLAPLRAAEPNLHSGAAHPGRIDSIEFSPDGSLLATTDREGRLRLWEVRSGRLVAQARRPDSHMRVYDLATGTAVSTLDDRGSVAVAPGGGAVVMHGDGAAIRVWDPFGGRLLGESEKGSSTIAFSRDGRLLASGRNDGRVEVWDLEATCAQPGERPGLIEIRP